MSSGDWAAPGRTFDHQRPHQYAAQRGRYDGHVPQQEHWRMPMVHYNGGMIDVHTWWTVATQQQQPQVLGYCRQLYHGFPALPPPSGHWTGTWVRGPSHPPNTVTEPCIHGQRMEADDHLHGRRGQQGWHSQAGAREAGRQPIDQPSSSPPRPPPSRAQMVNNGHARTPRDDMRRSESPGRCIRTPKSCPVARVDPAESSGRLDRHHHHATCWTVGKPHRSGIDDDSETLTNSMHKRRRVSRTEYLRLPIFSEDERDNTDKVGGENQGIPKGKSFIELLLEDRRKSTSSLPTPERSAGGETDGRTKKSAARTPAPTRRLSVIEEGMETPRPALRTQVSPPQTDPRSWYEGEETPSSSPSLPRINPADYGCGVPEDDGGFTTDVERDLADEEDIGSISDDDEEESDSSEFCSDESSSSDHEIIQRGDEMVRRKRRKECAKGLEFVDWRAEFNTGLFATTNEPTLWFKKVVTRRFGAKLRGHPMFREEVQQQLQEANGDKMHVAEFQI